MPILKQQGFVFALLFVIVFDKSKAQLRGGVIDPCYLCANNAPPRTPGKCLRLGYWNENGSYAMPSSESSGDCLGGDGAESKFGGMTTCQRLANQMADFQFSASMPQCRSLVDKYSASCCDEVPNEDGSNSIVDAEEQEWVVALVDPSDPVAIPPTQTGAAAGTGVVNDNDNHDYDYDRPDPEEANNPGIIKIVNDNYNHDYDYDRPDPEEANNPGVIKSDCGNNNPYKVEIYKPEPEWCCLCSECGLTTSDRGELELFPGTTCNELSVDMIDPEYDAPLGSGKCTWLQNKFSRICCDKTCDINYI